MYYNQLTSEQRYTISVLLQSKESQKSIAEKIGVSASTISRELKRNTHKRGIYYYGYAQALSNERKERLPGNRRKPATLIHQVERLLREEQWSPKQISGYLLREHEKRISHETIYTLIRNNKAQGGDLYTHCRHKLKHRKRPVGEVRKIPNRTSIHDRPEEANGSRFGDWEMDTIIGKDGKGAILTITERKTNLVIIEQLPHGKHAKELAKTVVRLLFPYRKNILSITTDNGSEFADHQYITKKLGAIVYFADPYASWQKGAIEHANKLIRQYIPKQADFNHYTAIKIKKIQHKINRRPREKLNFSAPKNEFFNFIS